MPGTTKNTLTISSSQLLFATLIYLTCDLSKLKKALTFFPTCKDFHN